MSLIIINKKINILNLNKLNLIYMKELKNINNSAEIIYEKTTQINLLTIQCVLFINHLNNFKWLSSFLKYFNYFLEIKKTIAFIEFKIIGLGFKVKKKSFLNLKLLKFDIGFSHCFKIVLPFNIKCIKGKKKFFLISNNYYILNNFIKIIINLRYINPYKIKGLKLKKKNYFLKQGKKQAKR